MGHLMFGTRSTWAGCRVASDKMRENLCAKGTSVRGGGQEPAGRSGCDLKAAEAFSRGWGPVGGVLGRPSGRVGKVSLRTLEPFGSGSRAVDKGHTVVAHVQALGWQHDSGTCHHGLGESRRILPAVQRDRDLSSRSVAGSHRDGGRCGMLVTAGQGRLATATAGRSHCMSQRMLPPSTAQAGQAALVTAGRAGPGLAVAEATPGRGAERRSLAQATASGGNRRGNSRLLRAPRVREHRRVGRGRTLGAGRITTGVRGQLLPLSRRGRPRLAAVRDGLTRA